MLTCKTCGGPVTMDRVTDRPCGHNDAGALAEMEATAVRGEGGMAGEASIAALLARLRDWLLGLHRARVR